MRLSLGVSSRSIYWLPAAIAALALQLHAPVVRACGCFTPPDPATPVVQAGERILFAVSGGQVTATIQIQYAGDARDFGWLLPLPSLPKLEVSSDEVFNTLLLRTAPNYHVDFHYPQGCSLPAVSDLGAAGGAADLGMGNGGPGDPLVVQDSVGPYDYAVLKADDKSAMLAWLAANRYFVPAGTDTAVNAYIHAGAFFLALKLHSGASVGDLQPVVVHYASDLPMIPIVLTSVTAQPKMGVWVWLLGPARAIPRNYHHVVLDDAALVWPTGSCGYGAHDGLPVNYYDQVIQAVHETPGHHAFLTELATPTKGFKDTLFPATRFGDLASLAKITDAGQYLTYLQSNGYLFSTTLVDILSKYIKEPANLRNRQGQPVSPANYYFNFAFWRSTQSQAFTGFDLSYDAAALTAEIDKKIVTPVRNVAAQFDAHPYFTRLFTELNPEDMTADPVFSFNPDLPDVSNQHSANMNVTCTGAMFQQAFAGVLTTEQGWVINYPTLCNQTDYMNLPATLRLETLREAGMPTVETDNAAKIGASVGKPPADGGGAAADMKPADGGATPVVNTGACDIGRGARGGGALALLLGATLLLVYRRRSSQVRC